MAERMVDHDAEAEIAWLVDNGIPAATAGAIDVVTRRAMAIRFATFCGAAFDVETLTFRGADGELIEAGVGRPARPFLDLVQRRPGDARIH